MLSFSLAFFCPCSKSAFLATFSQKNKLNANQMEEQRGFGTWALGWKLQLVTLCTLSKSCCLLPRLIAKRIQPFAKQSTKCHETLTFERRGATSTMWKPTTPNHCWVERMSWMAEQRGDKYFVYAQKYFIPCCYGAEPERSSAVHMGVGHPKAIGPFL